MNLPANILKYSIFVLSVIMSLTANAQEGTWSGSLDLKTAKLPLVFNFDADGCTMDSPSQGVKGIKAEKTYTPEGKIKITIAHIGAVYEGIQIMNIITGTFTQGNASLPLTIKPGLPTVNRPQTPKAPFPYSTEEITFNDGEVALHGTLTTPVNCDKNTPVVLMVTGSGKQNRDEEFFDHKPFAVIADALARQGIATLRYDDRGWEDPTFPFQNFTVYHFKSDAAAGVKELRNRFNRVGVLGHSEGGTIAMMLASEGLTDFIISMAGMAVAGRETLVNQNRNVLTSNGFSPEVVDTYCKGLSKAFERIVEGEIVGENDIPDVPETLRQNFTIAIKQAQTPYMKCFLAVNAAEDLQKIKCPVLAINGKLDTQVDCKTNLDAIEQGLTNCKHKTVAFDSLNHLFQHCKTGGVAEYQQIEETISPEVLEEIAKWIKAL